MTDLLKMGSEFLAKKRTDFMTTVAVYSRGAAFVAINLTKGKSDFGIIDQEQGFEVESRMADFIGMSADLILSGAVIKPAVGDIITMDDIQYEVLNAPDGLCWRYIGQFETEIRIHTKRITA
jgi:hypothetical protein